MQITYRFRYDADYIKAVVDRQYRQGPFLLRLPVQFGIVGLVCALVVIWSSRLSWANAAGLVLIMVSLMIVVGVLGTKYGLLLRFRSRAEFGSEQTVTLSEDGVLVSARQVQTKLEWVTYPSSVRFADGLLLQKPGAIRWLPDSGIQLGTADEATAVVGAKTSLRHVA